MAILRGPLRALGRPVAPGLALVLSALAFALLGWLRPAVFAVQAGLFAVGLLLWRAVRRA
jgi:hypothetical protein